MEITDIKIRKILTTGRMRAIASVTIDSMLALHDIKVVQTQDRLFVAMPSRKDETGNYRDIVHPISKAGREQLEQAVLAAYEQELALHDSPTEETSN